MSEEFQTILGRSRAGDDAASEMLFQRYVDRLTRLARARLSPQLARRVDAEDIVHSAYRSFFVRLQDDRFELSQSLDLWKLLVRIVHNKLARASRRHRAASRSYEREQPLSDAHSLPDREPCVDEVVLFNEQVSRLLAAFQGRTRQVIELTLQGYEQSEIADWLSCSERTVRRDLAKIRQWFEEELNATHTPVTAVPSTLPQNLVSDSDFLIQKFIGQGGFGRVYRSLDRRSGETVAIKFLKKRFLKAPEVISQFLQEAETTTRFDLPGIVPVLATGRTRHGQLFLVMRLIEGRDLTEWRRSSECRWNEIQSIIIRIAQILDQVHEQGLLHLDIKPQNMLVDSRAELWLTDFGMAQFRDSASSSLRGTLPYLAPEQVDSRFGPISRRSDFYRLGAVLFYLLTGGDFIPRTDARDLLSQIVEERDDREIISRLPDAVPAELVRLCCRLLKRDPEQRVSSARDVRKMLEESDAA